MGGIKKNTFITDITNENYHGEKNHFSSSQLKDVLEDIEYFYKVHISKELSKEVSGNQLNIGTYIHTAILEPHLLDIECAVWEGAARRGKEWEKFSAENSEKTIITAKEREDAEGCIKAVMADAASMQIIEPTQKEVSVFSSLMGVPLKARADLISCFGSLGVNDGNPYIGDLKSCSCNAKSEKDIAYAIENYNYDMSAALYLDLFSNCGKKIEDFYWIFTSKKWNNAQVWKATPKMLATGRAKLRKALALIHEAASKEWVFPSTIRDISPQKWVSDQWLEAPPPAPKERKEIKAKPTNDNDLL